MRHYLYQIRNKFNGKCYIGVTNNPKRRYKEHFESENGSVLIKQSLLKYGPNAFEFKILVIGYCDYIYDLEIKAIAKFNTMSPFGYNITFGGEGIQAGFKHSEETKQKISAALHARKPISTETRRKLSVSKVGNKHAVGYTLSEKHKRELLACAAIMNRKRVRVEGIVFNSMKDAADAIGMKRSALYTRFNRYKKANNFPVGWGYF